MKQFFAEVWHNILNMFTFDWYENRYRKVGYTNPPNNEDYEPAGIIHYGEYHLTIGDTHYAAYNQPDGRTVVWAGQEPIGDYTSEQEALYAILDHAKGNHDR